MMKNSTKRCGSESIKTGVGKGRYGIKEKYQKTKTLGYDSKKYPRRGNSSRQIRRYRICKQLHQNGNRIHTGRAYR